MKTAIGINGACGRMGQRLIAMTLEDPQLLLAAAIDAAGNPSLGRDPGELAGAAPAGIKITSQLALDTRLDVLCDFSTPDGTMAVIKACVARRIPLVIAT